MHDNRWYVAATSARLEQIAVDNLCRQGFRSFLPRRRKTVRHARKFATKQVAYFPGYVFTSFDLKRDRWRAINGTFGVKWLLTNGALPVAAPHGFVESLIEVADETGLVLGGQTLAPGARVKALSGPFAELPGILDRFEKADRIRVLFQIMNSTIAVTMHPGDVVQAV